MHLIASYILYYCGDIISRLMNFNGLTFLYPIYKKLMIWSLDLDKQGKVWDHIEK